METDDETDLDVCNDTSSEMTLDDDRLGPVPKGLVDLYKEHVVDEA